TWAQSLIGLTLKHQARPHLLPGSISKSSVHRFDRIARPALFRFGSVYHQDRLAPGSHRINRGCVHWARQHSPVTQRYLVFGAIAQRHIGRRTIVGIDPWKPAGLVKPLPEVDANSTPPQATLANREHGAL